MLSARRRAEIDRLVEAKLMTSERAFALLTACRDLLRALDRCASPDAEPPVPAVHPDQLPLFAVDND